MKLEQQLYEIIESSMNGLTISEICYDYAETYQMYFDDSFKSIILGVLSSSELFSFNNHDGIYFVHDSKHHYEKPILLNGEKTFRTHEDIMNEVFGRKSFPHQKGSFGMGNNLLIWFPKCNQKDWTNYLVDDGNMICEIPCSEKAKARVNDNNGFVEEKTKRITFLFDKWDGKNYSYKFVGVFAADHVEGGKRFYKKISSTIPNVGNGEITLIKDED